MAYLVYLGDQLYFTGGEVTIEVIETSAGYHSLLALFLIDPLTQVSFDLSENHQTGDIATIDPMSLGYSAGDELIFGIRVFRGGSHDDPSSFLTIFLMGGAERNPDGTIYAAVGYLGGGSFKIGFEDLWSGGDLDYNDNRFLFSGGVSTVSEPGTLLLLGVGLLGIGARCRMNARA